MAKKPAKTTQFSSDASTAGAAPKKASVSRTPKHLKAQASGVVAAVEGFVGSITKTINEEKEPAPAAVEKIVDNDSVPETASAPSLASKELASKEVVFNEVAPKEVTQEEIRALAYVFYLNRPAEGGSEAEDWLRAEQTLRAR